MDNTEGSLGHDALLQVILQERQQSCFVVFADFQVAQRMPFVWINLKLVRFVKFDEHVDQLGRMKEVHVIVDKAVNNKKSVVSANTNPR